MIKGITYERLDIALRHLGYAPTSTGSGALVYRAPDRRLMIILPDKPATEMVNPINLLSVSLTLANDGVVPQEKFDRLFLINKGDRLLWTDPATGEAARVTAAAGESDGLVVIERGGALVACPVDQVRKAAEVAPATNGSRRRKAPKPREESAR